MPDLNVAIITEYDDHDDHVFDDDDHDYDGINHNHESMYVRETKMTHNIYFKKNGSLPYFDFVFKSLMEESPRAVPLHRQQ